MNTRFSKVFGFAMLAVFGTGMAHGQRSWDECIDPMNTAPHSIPFGSIGRFNQLMHARTGVVGTVTYGGANGPCFAPAAYTGNIPGGFGFASGSLGSVQDQNPADPSSAFTDDNLIYSWGMPHDPNRDGGIMMTLEGNVGSAATTNLVYGLQGFFELWEGLSGRYYHMAAQHGNIEVMLRVDVIGDTAKVTWDLRNTDTVNQHTIGMWFGHQFAMLAENADTTGNTASFTNIPFGGKNGYIETPSGRPVITPKRYIRSVDPATFPEYMNFVFGQTAGFGLRMDMGPTAETKDINGNSDISNVDEVTIGTWLSGPPVFNAAGIPDVIIPDTNCRSHTQILQKYNPIVVNPIATPRIVQMFRSTWGVGNYAEPYTVVVDAPQLIASDPSGADGLSPNPMTIRVYIDNSQGFALAESPISLQEVRTKLTFPGIGLALEAGEQATKTLNNVDAGQITFLEWQVRADGIAFGDLPYKLEVESTPGGPKVLTGTIRVSSTPKFDIAADANLVGMPWQVNDNSWEAILALQSPLDFRAYKWDPQQNGYIVSTGAERGKAAWIVATSAFGIIDLQGNPTAPPDIASGAPNNQLKSGWNLIANPYPYAVQLGQIVGVPNGTPTVLTWNEMVQAGYINGTLWYYDPNIADYLPTQNTTGTMFPHRGYWVYVNTQNDLTLGYPAVFARFLPGSSRLDSGAHWTQTDKQWRLQLAARTSGSQDAQNYVGLAPSASVANVLRLNEVPGSPVANVSIAVEETVNGATKLYSQTFTDRMARKTWKVRVNTTEAATVTVTWPNLSTVPRNARFRITDLATGTVRDLRQSSGYTFDTNQATSREFNLEMIPGAATRAVIGNVLVARSRAALAPFSIRYTLSSDATTQVRVLSNSGKEVYSVHRGRADRTGENEVTWAMRDNANRLVAPGAYRVEILAETPEGERGRKTVVLNVIR